MAWLHYITNLSTSDHYGFPMHFYAYARQEVLQATLFIEGHVCRAKQMMQVSANIISLGMSRKNLVISPILSVFLQKFHIFKRFRKTQEDGG